MTQQNLSPKAKYSRCAAASQNENITFESQLNYYGYLITVIQQTDGSYSFTVDGFQSKQQVETVFYHKTKLLMMLVVGLMQLEKVISVFGGFATHQHYDSISFFIFFGSNSN